MPNREDEEQPPARPKQPYLSVFFEAHLDLARRGFVLPPFNPDLNGYFGLELATRCILTELASLPPTALSIFPQQDANATLIYELSTVCFNHCSPTNSSTYTWPTPARLLAA